MICWTQICQSFQMSKLQILFETQSQTIPSQNSNLIQFKRIIQWATKIALFENKLQWFWILTILLSTSNRSKGVLLILINKVLTNSLLWEIRETLYVAPKWLILHKFSLCIKTTLTLKKPLSTKIILAKISILISRTEALD